MLDWFEARKSGAGYAYIKPKTAAGWVYFIGFLVIVMAAYMFNPIAGYVLAIAFIMNMVIIAAKLKKRMIE